MWKSEIMAQTFNEIKYRKTKNSKRIDRLLRNGHPRSCYHCGKELRRFEMTLEHLCAKACGGTNDPSNLRISCAPCNNNRKNVCHRDCSKNYLENDISS